MKPQKLEAKIRELNGFEKFNPMQSKALRKEIYNKSVVISAPTASGKTVVAELSALNSIINEGKKVVYTCPLKAIASEHYRDFKKKYSNSLGIRVALSTGDMDSSSKYLSRYDLIFCTNEKIDSLIRHQAEWLKQVGLLVADEVHELDSDRGATLEMVISKLRFILPKLKILALSATIPNANELAEWLEAELIESDYRPVKLKEGILLENTIHFPKGKTELSEQEEQLLAVIDNTLELKKQALFFMNTRRNAEALAKKATKTVGKKLSPKEKQSLLGLSEKVEGVLESPTEQCRLLGSLIKSGVSFHHAGLLPKQRELVEDGFKDGKIKIISATPTLAAGVNLPSFRVVIPTLYRYTRYGMQRISVREYKQMCLPYDSKIIVDGQGELEIGDIVENELKCNVLSFDERTETLEFMPIVNFYKNAPTSLVRIKTRLGNELRLTPNHSMLVKEKDSFVWKKSNEIETGDKIVHQKRVSDSFENPPYFIDFLLGEKTYVKNCGNLITEAKKQLRVTERELANKIGISHKLSYHYKCNRKAMPLKAALGLCSLLDYSKTKKARLIKEVKSAYGNPITIPNRISEDFLWLVGFIATDGNINRSFDKRTRSEYIKLRVFNTDKRLIQKAKKVLLDFGLTPYESEREDGLISLEVGATLICRILKKHFGIPYGNKTTSVKIPKFLTNLNPKLIGAYLGGVFDGDGNYNESLQRYGSKVRRVVIVSSSKDFAHGIQKLLLKLGVLAKISMKENNSLVTIRNKKVQFSKPVYYVVFCKIEYIKKFQKYAKINKCKIVAEYSDYHNIMGGSDKRGVEFELVEIIKKSNYCYEKPVYNLEIKGNNNYFANNILVHNCGRAGRPKYDKMGESVLLARTEHELEELTESYVKGELEAVNSRLSLEPILRMHLLSLIASRFVFNKASLEDFFARTFYAKQYGSPEEILDKLSDILEELEDFEFIECTDGKFLATPLGKRVSDLYLDPVSAKKLVDALKKKLDFFSVLFALTNTFEFFPLVSVQKKREPELWQELLATEHSLPIDVASEQFFDSDLLAKFNSALLLREWTTEKSEQQLMGEFNIQPGILFAKLRICDWLAYAAVELSKLLDIKENMPALLEVRRRLKYGVKKELLPLVELRGIGRVRGRRLFRAGFRSASALKKANYSDLARVLGSGIAASVKQQLGQRVPELTQKKEKKKEERKGQSSLSSF